MLGQLEQLIMEWGLGSSEARITAQLIASIGVLLLGFISFPIVKRVILHLVETVATKTANDWDDKLIQHRVFFWIAHLAPATVVYLLVPLALEGENPAANILLEIIEIYMIVVGLFAVESLLNAAQDIYDGFPISHELPIKSFVQFAKIILYLVTFVLIFATLIDRSPLYLLSGMGVIASVLMLVFKDPILGLVAGIQLSSNRMVSRGDWVEMPQYGADGDVLEVGLTTVKIQNWDKTITTIPTSSLISESFKNWRGMSEAQGRRIKRSIYIDINTINRCTPEMIERFSQIRSLRDYIEKKRLALAQWNEKHGTETSYPINMRNLTNVGTFRAYIEAYLKSHPQINQDMTLLVRQLDPLEQGLPIEIYCFSKEKEWGTYENLQSDIFDHILATAPDFNLRIFQNPTGADFRAFGD
jgi:miniconductance mechanosensitive channel